MKTLTLGVPSERQREFLEDTHRYIAFGGARGGGKSWAVRVKAVLLAFRYQGIKIMIVRRTYPELRSNHIEPLKALLGDSAAYKESTKEFTFPTGSVIMFRHCANSTDIDKYQGTEVDVLFLDEATSALDNNTEREINDMLGRLKDQVPGLTVLSIAHRESTLAYCSRVINLEENGN